MNIPIETLVQYGLPTVLLSILVIGLWRGSKHIVAWIKPLVQTIMGKHLELIDTLKSNSTEQKEAISAIRDHLSKQSDEMEKQSGLLFSLNETVTNRGVP